MTTDEWCRMVLEQVFRKDLIPPSPQNPALINLAGRIWREWEHWRPITGAAAVAAHNVPYTPPDFKWLPTVLVSFAGEQLPRDQAFDFVFITGCRQKFEHEFRTATGSHESQDDFITKY